MESNELEHLTWHEVDEYLKRDRRLAFVLGSTEQHGHLAIGTDTLNALDIAREVTRAEGVLLAPPLHFGNAALLGGWPGTLFVSVPTYAKFVTDLAESAYRTGFRRLFFVNGHAGNSFVVFFLQELVEAHSDLVIEFYDWGAEAEIASLAAKIREGGATHANWAENWPVSRAVGHDVPTEGPPWWHYDRNIFLYSADEIKENAPSGSFGGVPQVPEEELKPLRDLAIRLARERLQMLGA